MARQQIPRYELADDEMDARSAKRFIQDELQLVSRSAPEVCQTITNPEAGAGWYSWT